MNIDISEEAGVRYLHFGSSWIQGAMRMARPYALELEYTREMMVPLLLQAEDWPRRVLQIGLGAGSLTKFLYRYRPQAKLTVVEIEPRVEAAARQFFKLPDDPARIEIRHGDGADFMARSKKRYDLILVDGFDADARTGRLDTLPFYLDCRARLADDGLLCVNLLSRRKDFSKSVARLNDAFDGRAIAFPSCDSGNAIALGAPGKLAVSPAPTFEELKAAAKSLKQASNLNLLPTLTRLAQSRHFAGGVLCL
ncbi:MAG: fused MFS/spermidine synthase [Burkholderiaceae bacterium]|nr:fused MFS/spermidine synthase [Burkholderiaceae bacterium]MCF8184570.1 fused MFS/spermidine synthase [Polynucleobacter sp.]